MIKAIDDMEDSMLYTAEWGPEDARPGTRIYMYWHGEHLITFNRDSAPDFVVWIDWAVNEWTDDYVQNIQLANEPGLTLRLT